MSLVFSSLGDVTVFMKRPINKSYLLAAYLMTLLAAYPKDDYVSNPNAANNQFVTPSLNLSRTFRLL